jgi:hypothetical protein
MSTRKRRRSSEGETKKPKVEIKKTIVYESSESDSDQEQTSPRNSASQKQAEKAYLEKKLVKDSVIADHIKTQCPIYSKKDLLLLFKDVPSVVLKFGNLEK